MNTKILIILIAACLTAPAAAHPDLIVSEVNAYHYDGAKHGIAWFNLTNYVGYPGYTLPKEWVGDVTGDGLIDTGDVILLSNYVGYPGYSLNCI